MPKLYAVGWYTYKNIVYSLLFKNQKLMSDCENLILSQPDSYFRVHLKSPLTSILQYAKRQRLGLSKMQVCKLIYYGLVSYYV